MTKTQTLLTPVQSRWRRHITDWESSGLSQAAYCKHQQLVYGTFIYWRHRLKKLDAGNGQGQAVTFLPVAIKPVTPKPLVLHILGQHSVELDADFDPVLLNRVVQALESGA